MSLLARPVSAGIRAQARSAGLRRRWRKTAAVCAVRTKPPWRFYPLAIGWPWGTLFPPFELIVMLLPEQESPEIGDHRPQLLVRIQRSELRHARAHAAAQQLALEQHVAGREHGACVGEV